MMRWCEAIYALVYDLTCKIEESEMGAIVQGKLTVFLRGSI